MGIFGVSNFSRNSKERVALSELPLVKIVICNMHIPNHNRTKFLKRPTNIGTVAIKSKRIDSGAGYGVELPCEFKFQGDNFSSNWLKIKLKKEKFDVLN